MTKVNSKLKLGLLYGGKSTEHEISIRSAKSVFDALNKEKYDVQLIYITKVGEWLLSTTNEDVVALKSNDTNVKRLYVVPGGQLKTDDKSLTLDAVFPVLHGTAGEDGSVQGLLELAQIPYVGCNVRSSALCMDKDMTKRLLASEGIYVANGVLVKSHEKENVQYSDVKAKLGVPMFIKPVNQGSSVGVSKVSTEAEFYDALHLAFEFDTKVMIETSIHGREIEVAVLGNAHPIASVPGEIVSHTDFYSYESKYVDENGAGLIIPAQLDESVAENIRNLAIKVYQTLDCEGLSRIDVFLTESGEIYVNEVNTLPGFTSISMYPKLFEETGIPYAELIDRLVELSMKRFKLHAALRTEIV